ncbi:unnamed protein product [Cuscuta europaea]|uniref:Endonuclease/exonuclease/phosphatase domain-containing protein n=1 Tax=Cuscuta europaea TaxID=41803 RepID=A0A9P1E417_CUSEU|nr:unnamed protein product [Cuscuta europaea]
MRQIISNARGQWSKRLGHRVTGRQKEDRGFRGCTWLRDDTGGQLGEHVTGINQQQSSKDTDLVAFVGAGGVEQAAQCSSEMQTEDNELAAEKKRKRFAEESQPKVTDCSTSTSGIAEKKMGWVLSSGPPGPMIILSWNCRGLGHPCAVPTLRDLVRHNKPDVIFLCETLCSSYKVDAIRRLLGFEAYFVVDREGRSGGLAILWRSANLIELINFSKNFINVLVKEEATHPWQLTGFYGIPDRQHRRESSDILRKDR